jgi:DNA-binding MarR family transcriptional regulator
VSSDRAREAAVKLVDTLPPIMQSIVSEIRRGDSPMPMPHFRILHVLVHHARNVSDLAESAHVSLPTMSNTVSVLVERGWVERLADPDDRRRAEICVTPEGRKALKIAEQRLMELVETRLGSLAEDEIDALIAALDILGRGFGGRHGFGTDAEVAE